MLTTIRARLLASYALVTVLAVGATALLGLSLVSEIGRQRERESLSRNAEAIAGQALPLLALQADPASLAELASGAGFLLDARVRILDPAATPLADSGAVEREQALLWTSPDGLTRVERTEVISLEQGVVSTTASPAGPPAAGQPALQFVFRRHAGAWGDHLGIEPAPALRIHLDDLGREFLLSAKEQGQEISSVNEPLSTTSTLSQSLGMERILAIKLSESSDPPGGALIGKELHRSTIVFSDHGEQPATLALAEQHGFGLPDLTLHVAASLLGPEADRETRSSQRAQALIGPGGQYGVVEISQAPDTRSMALASTGRAVGLAALAATLLALCLGLVVSRGLSAPLARLSRAAERMGEGDLGARADLKGQDEIGRLAARFNAMASSLESSFAQIEAERDTLRKFVADASHELRTPITALANYNSLLREGAADDEAQRADFLAEEAAQIERLAWITRSLLDLSRLDAGLITLDMEEIEASDILRSVVATHLDAARDREQTIVVEAAGPLPKVLGDRSRLELALGNLLANAIKFAPVRSEIGISVVVDDLADPPRRTGSAKPAADDGTSDAASAAITFRIDDAGPGVPPDERELVFARFHRGRAAAGRDGSGLGLAIVAAVAELHGGRAECADSPLGGARFTLSLPLRPRHGA
jgi:signal transduction histidine kinase